MDGKSITTKMEALTEADQSQTQGRVASVTAGETATQTTVTLLGRKKEQVRLRHEKPIFLNMEERRNDQRNTNRENTLWSLQGIS